MAGLSIDFYYEEGQTGKFTPIVGDVQVQNLAVREARLYEALSMHPSSK